MLWKHKMRFLNFPKERVLMPKPSRMLSLMKNVTAVRHTLSTMLNALECQLSVEPRAGVNVNIETADVN